MSYEYINWALFKTKTRKATSKFVLTYLAARSDRNGYCWPSVPDMVSHTLMNKKTIYTALGELEELRLITDTGKRKGHTGRVPVYKLNMTEFGLIKSDQIAPKTGLLNDTENGLIEDQKVVQFDSANRPKNGTIESVNNSHNESVNSSNNGCIKQTQKRDHSTDLIDPKTDLNRPKNGPEIDPKTDLNRPKNGSRNTSGNTPRNTSGNNPSRALTCDHAHVDTYAHTCEADSANENLPMPGAYGDGNKIPENFTPRTDTISALKARNVPDDFIDSQLAEFRIFWRDKNTSVSSWDATFMRRCESQWRLNCHTWSKNQTNSAGFNQQNINIAQQLLEENQS